jgi:hypothetical protein
VNIETGNVMVDQLNIETDMIDYLNIETGKVMID